MISIVCAVDYFFFLLSKTRFSRGKNATKNPEDLFLPHEPTEGGHCFWGQPSLPDVSEHVLLDEGLLRVVINDGRIQFHWQHAPDGPPTNSSWVSVDLSTIRALTDGISAAKGQPGTVGTELVANGGDIGATINQDKDSLTVDQPRDGLKPAGRTVDDDTPISNAVKHSFFNLHFPTWRILRG